MANTRAQDILVCLGEAAGWRDTANNAKRDGTEARGRAARLESAMLVLDGSGVRFDRAAAERVSHEAADLALACMGEARQARAEMVARLHLAMAALPRDMVIAPRDMGGSPCDAECVECITPSLGE